MARPVILSNGSLTVGINTYGLVHDFYYPYVGDDNLTSAREARHKIGIWVDGVFSWVDDGTWHADITFEDDALISTIRLKNESLQVEMLLKDFVDNDEDVFCRSIKLKNTSENEREIRLFMHQMFELSRGGRGDTAMYVPDDNYIFDYKGRTTLLIYGEDQDKQPFQDFAIGNYGIEGKTGTYKDAEDGVLSNNPIEHGGVDSVLGFTLNVEPGAIKEVNYWVVASDSQFNAQRIHHNFKKSGTVENMATTRKHWQDWLAQSSETLSKIPDEHITLTTKSLLIIKAHVDSGGGIIASCDSTIYNYGRDYYSYVWPRDGAYAIWPLIRLGYKEEAKAFFNFCEDVLTKDGYVMHKYHPDKSVGSTWHPLLHGKHKELAIQEDESAILIFMLHQYLIHTEDSEYVRSKYKTFISPIANFLATFIDDRTSLPHASYDLWEEKFGTSTYTTAVTYRALLNAAELAERLNHAEDAMHWSNAASRIQDSTDVFINPEDNTLRKQFLLNPEAGLEFDNTLDSSSLYGAYVFGLPFENGTAIKDTALKIESTLLDQSESLGLPRYNIDGYFAIADGHLGNPWIVTTMWYAQYQIGQGNFEPAQKYLNWVKKIALPSGVLSEQIHPDKGTPKSVAPLVWSHAEVINTILDLSEQDSQKTIDTKTLK
jgi:glucoamylase